MHAVLLVVRIAAMALGLGRLALICFNASVNGGCSTAGLDCLSTSAR